MLNTFAIGSVATGDISLFAKMASLSVLPFAHEDLAIILGGYLIVNKIAPALLVGVSIFGGIVASDIALYALGFFARNMLWLRRFTGPAGKLNFGGLLHRNIVGIVAICRVVPGVVFVAFIACGWMRVSFWRFTAASVAVTALYLPLMLYLAIVFGDALDETLGLLAWPALLGVFALAGLLRKRLFALPEVSADAAAETQVQVCASMPPIAASDRKVAAAEQIPPALFYIPMAINWVRLGLRFRSLTLPTASNPNIFAGGMWGETKSSYLLDVGADQRKWVADFVLAGRSPDDDLDSDVANALDAMAAQELTFPLIAKPDVGWHGHGVQLVRDRDALAAYLATFPRGAAVMLQQWIDEPAEAAVLYARMPGETRGRVLSLTLRYFPHVIGDGETTLRGLVGRDARATWKSSLHLGKDASHLGIAAHELDRVPERGEVVRIALIGNQRAGALYRDGRRFITEALCARFDGISRSMTEFHYGRFDIRFTSISDLMRGEGFKAVEINGIGGEAIDVWDPQLPVREVYRRLADQQKLLFLIGSRNRARGFHPMPVRQFLSSLLRQNGLIRQYPPSA